MQAFIDCHSALKTVRAFPGGRCENNTALDHGVVRPMEVSKTATHRQLPFGMFDGRPVTDWSQLDRNLTAPLLRSDIVLTQGPCGLAASRPAGMIFAMDSRSR